MTEKENSHLTTLTVWVRSLQDNWHVYFSAQLRCSSLNRMTIPLRTRKGQAGAVKPLKRLQLRSRALLDRKINAPLALFNYGF